VANGNCLAGEGPQASACSRTRAQRERHTLILESPPLMTAIVTPAYPAVNGTFTKHNSRCRVGCSLRGPVQALRQSPHPPRQPIRSRWPARTPAGPHTAPSAPEPLLANGIEGSPSRREAVIRRVLDQKGPATRHAWARLTRRYRRDLPVEAIHAGVSVHNDMPPDRLALRRYDEFGVTWPIPEQTVWRILVQQVT
jgi:hypothetical protein